MQNKTLTRFFYFPIMMLTGMAAGYGMAQPVTGLVSGKDCTIILDGIHQSVSCLEVAAPIPPVAVASCGAAVTLSFEDQYYNLGCSVSGFQGYFALSHWAVSTIQGDGGVDVTGAPNSILVEGANSASVEVAPKSEASVRIAIPACGFVSFDWSYIGGSNLLNKAFWIDVNGEHADGLKADNTSGNFFFGPLEAGDVVALNTTAGLEGFQVDLANFAFHSNAMAVVERKWKAEDEAGNQGFFTQWVSIKKPELSQVAFPGDFDGVEAALLSRRSSLSPDWAGYPVIDADGLATTTSDQYPLVGSRVPFELSWKDESTYENGLCITYREWTVTDGCGGNVIHHTQVIKLLGECPGASEPIPFGQNSAPGNTAYPAHQGMGQPLSSTDNRLMLRDSLPYNSMFSENRSSIGN
ncbi:MAG: hypothetical protein KDC66_19505 [Phaeodactylibacter sp.]|nr:hypothetical protein [Phaeodactylibacter sp.]MCB9273884.1 hypothetical protein [Lewinellaceae bacterium]